MPAQGMVHRGVRYAEADELAARLAAALVPAVRAGHAVAVAVDDPTRKALECDLGDAARGVEFVDVERPRRIDPFQLVARRVAQLAELARDGRRSVFVGQNQPGFGLGDAYWLRLEAALETACAGLPVDILCPYADDAPALRSVHREIVDADGAVRANPECRDPADVVGDLPAPSLPDLGPPAAVLSFDPHTLGDLRRVLHARLASLGFAERGERDLVYAVSEVATNSIEHGGGAGTVSLWASDGAVVCEVGDDGGWDFDDEPFPGVRPPSVDQPRGRGLWLARTLCDHVDVVAGPGSTRVRLALSRT